MATMSIAESIDSTFRFRAAEGFPIWESPRIRQCFGNPSIVIFGKFSRLYFTARTLPSVDKVWPLPEASATLPEA